MQRQLTLPRICPSCGGGAVFIRTINGVERLICVCGHGREYLAQLPAKRGSRKSRPWWAKKRKVKK